MSIGDEIPFRRNRFAHGTGSLILDRHRDDAKREAQEQEEPMRVWSSKGRFVRS